MKSCSRCKSEKDFCLFGKDKSTADGLTRYCKECISSYRRNKDNKEAIRKAQQRYFKKNKEKIMSAYKSYYKQQYQSNPCFRLKVNLRNRLNTAIKNGQKKGSAIKDLGCSIEELKTYLESKFYSHPMSGIQMSWDNWGKGKNKWNIDHVIEMHQVNIEDEVEFRKVNHFTNLQPLWWDDHARKSGNNRVHLCQTT